MEIHYGQTKGIEIDSMEIPHNSFKMTETTLAKNNERIISDL